MNKFNFQGQAKKAAKLFGFQKANQATLTKRVIHFNISEIIKKITQPDTGNLSGK